MEKYSLDSPRNTPLVEGALSVFVATYFVSGEGNGTPLQYSCLENPMDGGTWWAAVHGVAESWTRLSDFTLTFTSLALTEVSLL